MPVIGALVAGGVAYVTEFMDAWKPLSWLAAAMVGAILVQAWSLLRAWQGERDERKRRIALLEAPKGTLKPLSKRFEGERIFISDILPPTQFKIHGREFRDCEIVGPANVLFHGTRRGSLEMNDCGFMGSDGVVIDSGAEAHNLAVFEDCSFRGCTFVSVTILVPLEAYPVFQEGMPGLPWLNRSMIPKANNDRSQ